jgi:flagellar biosynthetic protein FlhB
MADQGQRTEQPTERRIQKARQEGNFPASREFVSSLQFAAFVALLTGLSTQWLPAVRNLTRSLLGRGFRVELTPQEVAGVFREVLLPAAAPLVAAGLALVALSLALQLGVTRFGLSLKRLAPDFKRLDPVRKLEGLRRQNAVQFAQAAVLLPLFLYVVYLVVRDNFGVFLGLPLLGVESGLARVAGSLGGLLWRAAGVFLVLGAIDLVRQRRRYRRDLRMSKQEVREEFKEAEGNPHVKARIRRLQRDLLRRQMMRQVPTATAVIVNPTHYAVAIRYVAEESAAPKVVAKGRNFLAGRIREKAVSHGVPVVENPPLARALYQAVEVGQEIPVHLYRAVAEILAYIYRLTHRRPPAGAVRRAEG